MKYQMRKIENIINILALPLITTLLTFLLIFSFLYNAFNTAIFITVMCGIYLIKATIYRYKLKKNGRTYTEHPHSFYHLLSLFNMSNVDLNIITNLSNNKIDKKDVMNEFSSVYSRNRINYYLLEKIVSAIFYTTKNPYAKPRFNHIYGKVSDILTKSLQDINIKYRA